MTTLTRDEIGRYARHLVMPEIGGPGQQALKRARVLLIGAGGIGSPAALYLAAAGVGTIGIADDDTVSLSNLQRQILHATPDVGRPKIDSAARAITALNPHVSVEAHPLRIDAGNGGDLVGRYDVVLDGSDNFATRYAMADLCEAARRPLVSAVVERFSGQLTVLAPHLADAAGRARPRYRDLFPAPPPAGLVASCEEAGVLGAVAGVIGTLAATEAVKLVCGAGQPLFSRLLLFDALAMRFEEIAYRRRDRAGRD